MLSNVNETYNGLTSDEAYYLTKIHGKNVVEIYKEKSLIVKYLEHFQEPMIALLFISGIISVFMGEYDDAISIFVAVAIVVTVGFAQEYRSDKSISEISRLLPPLCICVRDRSAKRICADDLVPGDLIILRAGDRVPADLTIIEACGLQVDESSFTGESCCVNKYAKNDQSESCNDASKLLMGTLVSMGHAKGIVISTGINTQFGLLYSLMSQEQAPKSPLKESMEVLGKQLTFYSLIVISIIVMIGIIQKRKVMEMLTMGVSLAVAAIPEGLPIVVTVTLALGVIKMAKRHAIVKKLPVIEALGCVTVFCSDKTGTLTTNEMAVVSLYTSEQSYINLGLNVSGIEAFDSLSSVYFALNHNFPLKQLLRACCFCNNAQYTPDGGVYGQPTECALLTIGIKCGLHYDSKQNIRRKEIPFSSETKWMGVEVDDPEFSIPMTYVKGAPDVILPMCHFYTTMNESCTPMDDTLLNIFCGSAKRFSSEGLRVIALAYGEDYDHLSFLGLVNLADPIRPDVPYAISQLRASSICCKILTGDSEETSLSIAKSIGISEAPLVSLSGSDLDKLSMEQLKDVVDSVSVFYRITPMHKIKIVKALRERGHIVAMTGDGVNDSIALRASHVGIAMGKSGTDVCKEAADIVLTDDNIKSLVEAISQGKVIFRNIQNFVRFQLSTSVSALFVTAISILSFLAPPLNAMQVLWINIIMDGPPAQSLGVEPASPGSIIELPRSVKEPVVNQGIMWQILYSALFITIGVSLVHFYSVIFYQDRAHQTTMSFTCFVFFDLFNAINCRSRDRSIFVVGFFTNKPFLYSIIASLIGQLMVIYFSPLRKIFQTAPLSFSELLFLITLCSTVFVADEVRKFFIKRSNKLDRSN